MKVFVIALLLLAATATAWQERTGYWAINFHDHKVMEDIQAYANYHTNKGRVQIVTLKEGVSIGDLPEHLRAAVEPIDPKIMSVTPESKVWYELKYAFGGGKPHPAVDEILNQITPDTLQATVAGIIAHGPRSDDLSREWYMDKFEEYGYEPQLDYNIEALKLGSEFPEELIIIEGHMDTVNGTVGADDNASGSAAVLEAARVLRDVPTSRSILFLITEDEEHGLLGAKYKVKQLRQQGRLSDVKFVVNMDMIGYNSNGIVDLETEPEFEELTDWMAELVHRYTTLQPNKVLKAWGSDHVPFINAGVEALLTIEHWNTHTPCWHRSCDKISTINFDYATQIARLNTAAVLEKAGRVSGL